jgi:hypothetical protein
LKFFSQAFACQDRHMQDVKFVDLSMDEQKAAVRNRFQWRDGAGWFTADGIFAGLSEVDVIAALVDLEAAEISAIGDCMGGCCMVAPRLEEFVRKPSP